MKKRKRLRLIVEPRSQYKLIFLSLMSSLAPSLFIFINLYFIIHSAMLEAKLESSHIYSTIIFLEEKILAVLIIGYILLSSVLIYWTTLVIHRIVGPIYRLEKDLDRIIKGEKLNRICFRKNDYFHGLADKINKLINIKKITH